MRSFLSSVLALNVVSLVCAVAVADDPLLRNVVIRGVMENCRIQFERHRTGHVAFLGGSITEMNGYRPMVVEGLRQRFPETDFKFTDAGIASTCSTTGAFRLSDDVLSQGPVDLLFVEFAVNDDQDAGHTLEASRRGMEGIVRQTMKHNPQAEIVITYFVNPGMLDQTQRGQLPIPIEAHNQVAEHYRLNTIVLTQELADRIQEGVITWERYGGTHPKPEGNAIPAAMIAAMFDKLWAKPLPPSAAKQNRELPRRLDPGCYDQGRFLPQTAVTLSDGWTYEKPDWSSIPGSFRARFADEHFYVASTPGAELTVQFEGRALGIYVLAGPDAGRLTCRIDGHEPQTINLFHHYSQGLHYPRTVMFATDLEPGRHTARITLDPPPADATPERPANAARILRFVAN